MKETLPPSFHKIANYVDCLLLAPELSQQETVDGCLLAKKLQVSSVNVKPCYVKQAVNALKGFPVAVGTVVGFPFGANTTHVKVTEVKRALTEGATTVEMMINSGYVRDLADDLVRRDILGVCGIAHMNGGTVNVILPYDYLSEEQIIRNAIIASKLGVNGITITGENFNSEDIMNAINTVKGSVGNKIQIKAMGDFSSRREFLALVEAGCYRIGVKDLKHLLKVFDVETA